VITNAVRLHKSTGKNHSRRL